jgi:hypothetical protein
VSSLTPANDVLIGVTNNTQSWLGARYSNIQQGYLGNFSSPTSKISNTPFAVGVAQPVSIDYGVPFDVSADSLSVRPFSPYRFESSVQVELYTKACASCTSAGNLTGVVRTWNGWVTWQVPITSFPVVGPLSLLTLKPTSTPSTDSVSFVRLQLSASTTRCRGPAEITFTSVRSDWCTFSLCVQTISTHRLSFCSHARNSSVAITLKFSSLYSVSLLRTSQVLVSFWITLKFPMLRTRWIRTSLSNGGFTSNLWMMCGDQAC